MKSSPGGRMVDTWSISAKPSGVCRKVTKTVRRCAAFAGGEICLSFLLEFQRDVTAAKGIHRIDRRGAEFPNAARAAASAPVSRSKKPAPRAAPERPEAKTMSRQIFHARALRLNTTRFVTRKPSPIAMKAMPRTTNSKSLSKNRATASAAMTSMPRLASINAARRALRGSG